MMIQEFGNKAQVRQHLNGHSLECPGQPLTQIWSKLVTGRSGTLVQATMVTKCAEKIVA